MPPFATADANAAAVAALLLWSFPEQHGADKPITTERWEALMNRLRRAPGDGEPAGVLAELATHAPEARVAELMASARALGWPSESESQSG